MTAAPVAVPSFLAGYAPAPSDFDSWIQTPFAFATGKVVFRGQQTNTGQSLSSGTYTVIQLNSILEDPYGGYSSVATSAQPAWSWLAPYDGWYEVTVTVSILNVAAHLEPALLLSGTTQYEAGAASTPASPSAGIVCAPIRVPMIGGLDYVQPQAWISAAATTEVGAGLNPVMEIAWISN